MWTDIEIPDAERIQVEGFLRITQNRRGAKLQSRRVTLRDRTGQKVTLLACVHVGSQEYYDELVAVASNHHNCSLYELITAEENIVTDDAGRRRLARRSVPTSITVTVPVTVLVKYLFLISLLLAYHCWPHLGRPSVGPSALSCMNGAPVRVHTVVVEAVAVIGILAVAQAGAVKVTETMTETLAVTVIAM